MILQALVHYYERMAGEESSGIAPEGFEKKEIPFIIIIDKGGYFKGLQDTRDGQGKDKRARAFIIPKAVKRSSTKVAANLLWDTSAYVLGRPKPDKKKDYNKQMDRAKKQHDCFKKNIKEICKGALSDDGIAAVIKFLERGDFSNACDHPLWQEIEESGSNITFMLDGDDRLVCQREAVKAGITGKERDHKGNSQICLISGEIDTPARLHTPIKGVWGAKSSGARIVSFNRPAFCSHGKTQSFNAPVGEKAEHAYTTALNTLLSKNSRQRIQVGDASTVFWSERKSQMEKWFAEFFGEPPKGQGEQENEAIRALYSSPETGARSLDKDYTRFFVLGLSPNASRIAIRFWYAGTVSEVAKNIRLHFDDCAIIHRNPELEYLSLFRMLVSIAAEGNADNIQPNLAGDMMKSILTGAPYPRTLLGAVIRRIYAEREITYARASLVKAMLVRDARYYKRNGKETGMSLDLSNINPGYLLGRLFAVLERAQELASPGINATIRDRFYSSASSTPCTTFPHLLKLKNHHISKLENRGAAINLERLISEIMDGIPDLPSLLSLQDQGRFAVGYYHQRHDFFQKKN